MLLASLATVAVAQPTTTDSHPEKPAPPREIRPLVFGASLYPALTSHAVSFTVRSGGPDCGAYDGASNFTLAPDLFALWRTPWNRSLWLTGRLGYRSLGIELLSDPTRRPFDNAVSSETDTAVMITRFDVGRSGMTLALGAAYEPIAGLLVGIAPTLTVASADSASHTDSIVAPREARFAENDHWTRPFREGTVIGFNRVVLGIALEASASVPMGERLALYPGVRAEVSLTSHSPSVSWRTWSIAAGLGIGFDVSRHRVDTVAPIAVQQPPPPSRRPFLRATIDAKGIDENGREYDNPVIEIEETPWIEVVPLLPYIFFDSASAEIAGRYVRLAGRDQARRFSIDSLLDVDPIDMHWQSLNVIGSRLEANPTLEATLIGTGSGDEERFGPELRRLRAMAVRDYLVGTWGIDPQRLHVVTSAAPTMPSGEETPEGRAENRRVEISVSEPSLLDHVTVRRTASIASPPAVKFYPRIIADSAIAEWKISVVQGEKELLRFAGTGDEESLKQNKLWSLADLRVNRDLSEIRYRLDVRDVTGQTTAADGRFRVIERTHRSPGGSTAGAPTIVEHFLVGFNYNTATLLPQHRQRIGEIVQAITPDDELLLVGYTDRIGAQERNKQLSLERARVVYEALHDERFRKRLPDDAAITVRGYGPQEELFDNALPEGRMFSRMVRVVITSYRDE
jgi:outer membrane protein OmpA-like peptidoglycan-associated protein